MQSTGPAGAAAAAAPASASIGSYRYKPPDCLLEMMGHHKRQDHALHNARKELERQRNCIKDYKADAKLQMQLKELIPVVQAELFIGCTRDEMTYMIKCEKAIADLGGIGEVRKLVKLCKDADDRASGNCSDRAVAASASASASSERVNTNLKYRAFLKSNGLKHGSTYKVKWTKLVDFFSNKPLPEAYSFAMLLPDCETKAKNPDADPTMLHIRLPLVVFNEVNELYIDNAEGVLEEVTNANAMSLCDTVFEEQNMRTLHAADGGTTTSFPNYRAKLVKDSVHSMSGRLRDFYPTLEKMAAFTGESSSRPRGVVNYRDKRTSKRPRDSGDEGTSTHGTAAGASHDTSHPVVTHDEAECFVAGVLAEM